MLFNSYEFLLLFFPVSVALFYLASRFGARYGIALVILASFFFYAWWDVRFLVLLIGSIAFNYIAARTLGWLVASGRERDATIALTCGIFVNLATLGFFKYGQFILDNLNAAVGGHARLGSVVLPLGISFFTFEQIAYLVDVRRKQAPRVELLPYAMFVSFFPRLVAGPILRYGEIFPQLARKEFAVLNWDNLSVGLSIFLVGLFKKTFIADGVSTFANVTFANVARGQPVDLFLAWGGVLAYTFQLYFDFSAYSDMAIGIARVFGIRFPVNFFSPYRATSIIEFWRLWHITLSRFLRDYLYISLGGNRHGSVRRYANLLITMLLGGLWHGANWTFVFWGGLHGVYLVINHGWRSLSQRIPGAERLRGGVASTSIAWLVTFTAVVVAWVFFRSATFAGALQMLKAMCGLNGVLLPSGLVASLGPLSKWIVASAGVGVSYGSGTFLGQMYLWIVALFAVTLLLPNTMELFSEDDPALNLPPIHPIRRWPIALRNLRWEPSTAWSVAVAGVGLIAILSVTRASEFLYWQF